MKKAEIKSIYYLDFWDADIARNHVSACTNKMESVCKSLNDNGYDVKIISMSEITEKKFMFRRGHTITRHPGLKLKLFASWGGKNALLRRTKILWHLFVMWFYLVINTKKGEPVIVYHSLGYFSIIKWAKYLRKFKLILEVEEIYQDVAPPKYALMTKIETEIFSLADAFIFPTELLNKKLNPFGKPAVIIYGTYLVEPQVVEKWTDGRVHVVYAGTFDPRKGGAVAVAAAAFLPENYHIHICGFGTEDDTRSIKKIVDDTAVHSRAKITFHGLLKGREYIEFIQRCHIGLSTQDPSAAFNATSFPSKILSYMANGLEVVSIDIPAIREASISSNIHFYSEQTPEQIAEAITAVDLSHPHDNRALIASLSEKFINDLPSIL